MKFIKNLKFRFDTVKPFGFRLTLVRDRPENIFMLFHFGLGLTYEYNSFVLPTPKYYFIGIDFFRKIKEGEEIKYVATFHP